ncbi:MAG: hypothetical protein WCK32_02455 [Chlorobiaceae bacterium]
MKRKATLFYYTTLLSVTFLAVVFVVNQLSETAKLISPLHPYAGALFLLVSSGVILISVYSGIHLFSVTKKPELPDHENSKLMTEYSRYLVQQMPVHPKNTEPLTNKKEVRWIRTNLKFLEIDALNATKEIATKNFFVGAFAQNTSYGTTTSLLNNIKAVWAVYTIHNRQHNLREFIDLVRSVYTYLPLSDFKKEEIPDHIKPIIQASFSNTLSSLLPAGNLLTPFFLNLFLSGSTNTYLTCLAGIIAIRQCQIISAEDQKAVIQQSMFEASFMLKEIVRECNPILSVTISKAVKQAGIESLDKIQTTSSGSGIAQDIVSHLASSLKNIIRENISTEKKKSNES